MRNLILNNVEPEHAQLVAFDGGANFIDPEGLTASQYADMFKSVKQFTPEQRLWATSLIQSVLDWKSLMTKGYVARDPHRRFALEDAYDLHDFLFADKYGADDHLFVSCRTCCKLLGLELADIRKHLLTFGTKSKLSRIGLKTREEIAYRQLPEAKRAKAIATRAESAKRRLAAFENVTRNGCRLCDDPKARVSKEERYVHKGIH